MPEQKNERAEKEKSSGHAKPERKIIRLGETNLDGSKRVDVAIRQVKGVSFVFANAVAKTLGFENRSLGDLSESELKTLEDALTNPAKYDIPSWLFNRRKDPDSGTDTHLLTSNLELTQKMDIDRMKKIKCYRGVRHILDLPVRGQRTRSSFRKGKTIGVSRKAKAKQAAKSGK